MEKVVCIDAKGRPEISENQIYIISDNGMCPHCGKPTIGVGVKRSTPHKLFICSKCNRNYESPTPFSQFNPNRFIPLEHYINIEKQTTETLQPITTH